MYNKGSNYNILSSDNPIQWNFYIPILVVGQLSRLSGEKKLLQHRRPREFRIEQYAA